MVPLLAHQAVGKAQFLRYLLGTKAPDSGELLIAGQNIGQINKELLKLRLNIGMLFQSAALFDSLNIEENIAFPLIENYGLTLNVLQEIK